MTHRIEPGDRTVQINPLARVEGEGALRVELRDGTVRTVELDIFEPPRFFEALVRGRRGDEAPDITARICGICPVAYELSACAAVEDAFGVAVSPEIRALRRLLYCGEWIQSHALHVVLLHAPDFLGCEDAVQLAALDRAAVERGLRLKRIGNRIMEVVGGRAIHPVNVRVGGFYRAPPAAAVQALAEPLARAIEDALATVRWVAAFDFPDLEADYRFVGLRGDGAYPIEAGRIVSSDGLDLDARAFERRVVEEQVLRSTALHARLDGRLPYLTGPLARFALNHDLLDGPARTAATEAGLVAPCRNPFRSIVVRAVEIVAACVEALRLVDAYRPPDPAAVAVAPRAGTGCGATEAPRGLLLHRYDLDETGVIRSCRIVPPTSQNQLTIEDDLRRVVESGLHLGDRELGWRCEQAVRNHDPCISCAAHFLRLEVDRR